MSSSDDSGSDSDGSASKEHEDTDQKLFMDGTISRDVNKSNEEERLLSILNPKFGSLSEHNELSVRNVAFSSLTKQRGLRLNNSHETIQPGPHSQERIPPRPGTASPGMMSRGPGPPPSPSPPPSPPSSWAHRMPSMGSLGSRRPLPPPPGIPKLSGSQKRVVRAGPPLGTNRTRASYSATKSLRSSKWRRKLQGNQVLIPRYKLQDSSEEPSSRPTGDDVGSAPGEKYDVEGHSVINSRKPAEVNSLAESLSTLTKQHLELDVLNQSNDVSKFISYLLDTIEMLEAQVSYKNADSESDESESNSDEENTVEAPAPPCFHTIHRICCGDSDHRHNGDIFEDEPVARKKSSSVPTRIEAKDEITNMESYLSKHPEFCFIIIKEHTCVRTDAFDSLTFQRRSDALDKPSERSERLIIIAPLLRKALDEIAQYTLVSSDGSVEDELVMDAPYPFLFHHRERLAELAESSTYGSVISPLLEFLDKNYRDEYEEATRMFDQGIISARHLQKLFKPNQLVISNTSDNLSVYALEEAPIITKENTSFTGWSYYYAEVDLQQKPWSASMSAVGNDDIEISSLQIHPVKYGSKADLEKLTQRGQAFWGMKGQHYRCYTGWDHRHDHYYTSARFMVDLATHHLMHPLKRSDLPTTKKPSKNRPFPMKVKWEDEMTPETILLLPSTVYGFNLQEKKWVDLDVDKFHPVTWNKDAFKRLVLDEKTKEMIYALVDIQTATKKMDDIITGKGNGLIVLLHGSPGTGKTLTAESVAEIAEKPLYRVTCGDIGTEAQDVEQYLATVLHLGKLWDCVLLLDEADVFLEERSFADLQRNSLVSVFLRILEYYEGILILTSNRVGHFDEAFKSRIQVALHYDNLSKKSRKAIWQNFLDMIEESADEEANIAELEEHLDQLASEEMNGRQIRNALLTARQLAKHRKERLEWVHLDQVMKTSAAFNKYLKTVRGQSDDKIAREEGRR